MILLVGGASFVVLVIGFGLLFGKLFFRLPDETTPDWETIFSPARYEGLKRLLIEGEQRLFFPDKTMATRMRRERAKAFRMYLQRMSSDFQHISGAIKLIMVQSQVDRPDLARILLQESFAFRRSLTRMELRLTMYEWGWSGFAESQLAGMCQALSSYREQLQGLAAGSAAASA